MSNEAIDGYNDVTSVPELLVRLAAASMTLDTSHACLARADESRLAEFCRTHADRERLYWIVGRSTRHTMAG